jgi:hypothetical protein
MGRSQKFEDPGCILLSKLSLNYITGAMSHGRALRNERVAEQKCGSETSAL